MKKKMSVKKICQLLLVVYFYVLSFDLVNGNINIDTSAEAEKIGQNFFQHVPKNCTDDLECGRWGVCKEVSGGRRWCECMQGASGENCDAVDQCESKQVDCGSDDSAECILGDKGKAHCNCKDNLQYYDDSDKRCLDCECGENVLGCKVVNDVKTCVCDYGYAIKGGICEECYCGEGANCHFEGEAKVCTCRSGFIPSQPNGTCLQVCNATHPCQNGGTCEREVCSCLNGTSGSLCREIAECRGLLKCGAAYCLFNATGFEAYCHCPNNLKYDDYNRRCSECDCGEHQKDCEFKFGRKKCTCLEPYRDRKGECASCSCNEHTAECSYDYYGEKICKCNNGYIQKLDECKECNCGYDGKCEFDFFDNKICTCNENYSYNGHLCEYCDCGKNGTCAFDESEYGIEYCTCDMGFMTFRGKCKECECGDNAECSFTINGEKICKCRTGYEMNSGVCEACDCGLQGSECSYAQGVVQCKCPELYSEVRNSTNPSKAFCGFCDCGLEGSNCTFVNITTRCQCPKGYVESWNTTDRLIASCEDIDECLRSGACPSSANCINRPGSYDCKEGYKEPAMGADYIKTEGCEGSHPWKTAGIVIGCVLGVGLLIGLAVIGKKYEDKLRI